MESLESGGSISEGDYWGKKKKSVRKSGYSKSLKKKLFTCYAREGLFFY